MAKLTSSQREAIIERRGNISDGDGKKHRTSNIDVHHKDRNTDNNDPRNLRLLTRKEHQDLHGRSGG